MLVDPAFDRAVVVVGAFNGVAGGSRRVGERLVAGGVNTVQTDSDEVRMSRVAACAVCDAEKLDVGV